MFACAHISCGTRSTLFAQFLIYLHSIYARFVSFWGLPVKVQIHVDVCCICVYAHTHTLTHSYQLQLVNSFDYLSALIKASQKCLFSLQISRENTISILFFLCSARKIRINMNKSKFSKYKNEYNRVHSNVKFAQCTFFSTLDVALLIKFTAMIYKNSNYMCAERKQYSWLELPDILDIVQDSRHAIVIQYTAIIDTNRNLKCAEWKQYKVYKLWDIS